MSAEIVNARVESTRIGYDHGCLSAWVFVKYSGGAQGFGGYVLDNPIKDEEGNFLRREGCAFGAEFINRILKAVGAESWEKLPGTPVRVDRDHSHIARIGHFLEDRWFDPKADLEHLT